MEWEISPEIFAEYRQTEKKLQLVDDQIVNVIKKIFLTWNQTGPGFGLKIEKIDGSTHQGLAWYICIYQNHLRYYFEEYQKDQVIITPYSTPINQVMVVHYLGKTKTVRPFIDHKIFNCSKPCQENRYERNQSAVS